MRSQSLTRPRKTSLGVGGKTGEAKHGEITSLALGCSWELCRVYCVGFDVESLFFSDLDACEPKRRFAVVQGSGLQVLRRLVRT